MVYRSPHDEDDDVSRVCKVCGERKPFEEFFLLSTKVHRRRTCKSCVSDQRRVRHAADPSIRAAAGHKHNLKQYGLTPELYEVMVAVRRGLCDICCLPMTPPHVDHCHRTGKVRGLLCFDCNTGLGKFRDDPNRLDAAISYLEDHRA